MMMLQPGTAAADAPLARPRILVVDDVEQNLVAMRALLEAEDVTVVTARSGAEALEVLLAHDFAMALLDVQMPGMDGFELAELMRGMARTRRVPIVFMTAAGQDPARTFRGYDAGAVDFLHKPVDPQVIGGKVRVFAELYRQREELREKNEALEQALALNEKMMAVLSHDLRTPLSVVHLSAFALQRMSDAPRVVDTARKIAASVQRMTRMIEQLLDFSRLKGGGLRLMPCAGRLDRLVEQVAEECRQGSAQARIEVEATGDMQATFDHDRLAQVVSNLMANALRHAGDEPVRVRIDGTRPERVRFEIANAGALPEALLPRLFEPFKAAFHDDEGGGLGLGLYIVEQFVRAHGGSVGGANRDGQVVFTVELPRVPPLARAVPGAQAAVGGRA